MQSTYSQLDCTECLRHSARKVIAIEIQISQLGQSRYIRQTPRNGVVSEGEERQIGQLGEGRIESSQMI